MVFWASVSLIWGPTYFGNLTLSRFSRLSRYGGYGLENGANWPLSWVSSLSSFHFVKLPCPEWILCTQWASLWRSWSDNVTRSSTQNLVTTLSHSHSEYIKPWLHHCWVTATRATVVAWATVAFERIYATLNGSESVPVYFIETEQ